jgi:DNA-binding Lrp family transcriptional regulator
MSQEDVLDILKELKGNATTKEIRDFAKKKYRERTLYLYVTNRLKKLEKNGKITREGEKWKIKKR